MKLGVGVRMENIPWGFCEISMQEKLVAIFLQVVLDHYQKVHGNLGVQ